MFSISSRVVANLVLQNFYVWRVSDKFCLPLQYEIDDTKPNLLEVEKCYSTSGLATGGGTGGLAPTPRQN